MLLYPTLRARLGFRKRLWEANLEPPLHVLTHEISSHFLHCGDRIAERNLEEKIVRTGGLRGQSEMPHLGLST